MLTSPVDIYQLEINHQGTAQEGIPPIVPGHPDTLYDRATHHQCQSVDDDITATEDSAAPSEQVAFFPEYFSEDESLSEQEIVWVRSAGSGSHRTGPQQLMSGPTTFVDAEPDQIRDASPAGPEKPPPLVVLEIS